MHDGQQDDPKAKEDRQNRTYGGVFGQSRTPGEPIDAQQPKPRRCRRSQQQSDQVAPVAAKGNHCHKGKPNARQCRMADRVAHKGAFAQEKKGARHTGRHAQTGRSQHHQRGIIAKLQRHCLPEHQPVASSNWSI